ncbi:Uncharacterised protein [Legionella busanensis]|uniref:Uncharacterized protein n=1 Tax=Legionella busanensis TaxID=190655 RepID=A0A378JKG9_9GAMM|nr:hypothetical protein [Legionella busanensis]STX50813.1 Uncharacterised protein [Legionella busanensis]
MLRHYLLSGLRREFQFISLENPNPYEPSPENTPEPEPINSPEPEPIEKPEPLSD